MVSCLYSICTWIIYKLVYLIFITFQMSDFCGWVQWSGRVYELLFMYMCLFLYMHWMSSKLNHSTLKRSTTLKTSELNTPDAFSERLNYRITSIFRTKIIHPQTSSLSQQHWRNGHARGPTALSPAPTCAYYAMLFTEITCISTANTTSGTLRDLSTTV